MNINTLQEKLPKITLLIIVPVMITALSLQAYTIFAPSNDSPDKQIKAVIEPVEKRPSTKDIKKYQLFGAPSNTNTQKAIVKTENLPKTNLRLILRGVSASGENNSNASALIEGPNKETLKYSINNPLPGKAKLRSVYENRIVIERNGRLENLYFPDSQSIGIVSSAQSTDAPSESPPQTSYQPKAASASSSPQAIPKAHVPQNFSRPASNLDTLSDQRKEEIKLRLQKLREKMKQSQ